MSTKEVKFASAPSKVRSSTDWDIPHEGNSTNGSYRNRSQTGFYEDNNMSPKRPTHAHPINVGFGSKNIQRVLVHSTSTSVFDSDMLGMSAMIDKLNNNYKKHSVSHHTSTETPTSPSLTFMNAENDQIENWEAHIKVHTI